MEVSLLRALRNHTVDIAALERVEAWVRERFRLSDRNLVLVREEAAAAVEGARTATVILFWDDDGERYRLRLFTPVAEVRETDLPASWLRGTLKDEGDGDCC